MQRRRCISLVLFSLALALAATLVAMTLYLPQHTSSVAPMRPSARSARLATNFPGEERAFRVIGTLPSHAAAGIASLRATAEGDVVYIAVANYYGAQSAIYSFSTETGMIEHVQSIRSHMAHDWAAMPDIDGRAQLVLANYGSDVSLVFELRTDGTPSVVERPDCVDADARCSAWAHAGECARNPSFMSASCAHSCGCNESSAGPSPFAVVQVLHAPGACAAHYVRVTAADRHLLALATAANATHGVHVFEWSRTRERWEPLQALEVRGVAAFAHCETDAGGVVLVAAQWHTGRTFATRSQLFVLGSGQHGVFAPWASVATSGAHDAECFAIEREATSEQRLALGIANVRSDETQRVQSAVYWLDERGEHGRELQLAAAMDTAGAHDLEYIPPAGPRGGLLVVPNQGDGTHCNATTDVYSVRHTASGHLHLALVQAVPTGCATFAHHFVSRDGRLFLAVAVERIGDDPENMSSFSTSSLLLEYAHL